MAKKNTKHNFKFLDTRLTINYVDHIKSEENHSEYYGQTTWKLGEVNIKIATKDEDDKDLPQEVLDTTLRHELYHAILDKMYFRDESKNETLVEWLAQASAILNKQGLKI